VIGRSTIDIHTSKTCLDCETSHSRDIAAQTYHMTGFTHNPPDTLSGSGRSYGDVIAVRHFIYRLFTIHTAWTWQVHTLSACVLDIDKEPTMLPVIVVVYYNRFLRWSGRAYGGYKKRYTLKTEYMRCLRGQKDDKMIRVGGDQ
jgi:hypothetical protein